MCNDYEQHVRWAEYRKMIQALELVIPGHQSEFDLLQADDVRINELGPVMRSVGGEIELVPMSFSFPPGRPRGAPVFNFRSEGRHSANSTRCIVPASAFFEFTGTRYPKAKHRFALRSSPITAIAAITVPVDRRSVDRQGAPGADFRRRDGCPELHYVEATWTQGLGVEGKIKALSGSGATGGNRIILLRDTATGVA
jgi:putative SOS response-associated peptidase YedK